MARFELVEALLTPGRGGRPGRKIEPRALVVHWTANTDRGADAMANRNYFERSGKKVSAHYVVDDRKVVRCLPEDEMAYHVGAMRYMPGVRDLLGGYPNATTIGIEMCVHEDGDFARIYRNTVDLAADIMRRHSWGPDRLLRHYDVTGKRCPAYFVEDQAARRYGFESARVGWEQFRRHVAEATAAVEVVELFKDVQGHWAQKDVEWLAREGLIKGDEHGNFHPNQPITRAEAAVLMRRTIDYIMRRVIGRA